MASFTRTRGRADTATPFGRAASASTPVFAAAILAALALHAPFAPSAFSALVAHFFRAPVAAEELPAETVIPVDLDLESEPSAAGVEAVAELEKPKAEPVAHVAKAPAAPVADDDPYALPPPPPSAAPSASPAALRDPVEVAGAIGRVAAKDANVQILVASDRLRKHELGMNFAKLLVNIPEWRSFFEGTGIDPLRDFDHLLVAGPKFKDDSSHVVAVMDYHVPDEAVRAAIDVIVQRSGGAWLEGTKVPAARATAAGKERVFALLPKKHLLAILPVDALPQLDAFASTRGFGKSSKVGIAVSMVTPTRPMAEVMDLPSWIAWMRLAFTPTASGGDLKLEFGDRSPEDAERDAKAICASYDRARTVSVPLLGTMSVLDAAEFSTEGSVIRAKVSVTELQLRRILAFATAKYATPPPEAAKPSADQH